MMRDEFKEDYNLNALKTIDLGKFKMFITPRFFSHYVKNRYEPFSSKLVTKYLRPNSIFVDVGAHYGYYSLLASCSQKNVKVISIEPVLENCEILRRNFQLNNIENYELYNSIASDCSGDEDFHIAEAADSGGIYEHPLAATKKIVKIKSLCLDAILLGKKVDFIKIDVEGAEIVVLTGLQKTIKNNKDIFILVEFNPACLGKGGFQPGDFFKKIHALELESFLIDEHKGRYYRLCVNGSPWKRLMNIKENPLAYANILCVNRD